MIINTIGSGGGGVKLPPMSNPVSADKVPEGFETIGQDGTIVNGTLPAIVPDDIDITMDDATGVITADIPNGYVGTNGITTTFDVPIVDVATPTLSINENGLVTANVVQAKGWVKEVTSASGTMQLQVRTDDDLTISDDGVVTAPAGYYPNAASKTASVEPEITVSTTGLITASAGSLSKTHQITRSDIPTLLPGNIRSGVNICGVNGTVTGGVATRVTVTTGVAGAVVTAKCGSTTQTGTCNNSGVATVYLTMAGTWTITAEHPTNGAYSTNSASVTVQDNFPISLTVGSSTTVSANGLYTATLNMAYRPSLAGYISAWAMGYGASAVNKSTSSNSPSGYYEQIYFIGGSKSESGASNYYWNSGSGSTYTVDATGLSRYTSNSDRPYYDANSYITALASAHGAGCSLRMSSGEVMAVYTGGHGYSTGNYLNQICIGGISEEHTGGGGNVIKITYSAGHTLSVGRAWHSAVGYKNYNYALIAGGKTSDSAVTASVDTLTLAQDLTVTRGTATNLSVARHSMASICHENDFILFAGGVNSAGSPVSNVDAYNSARTKSTPTALSVARYNMATAIAGGTFALFAGGISGNGVSTVIDAYNLSRTRTTPCTLSVARHLLSGMTVGQYAIFAGGRTAISSGASNIVDMFDSNLTRSTMQLKVARYAASAESARWSGYCVGCINGGLNASGGYIANSNRSYCCEYFSIKEVS